MTHTFRFRNRDYVSRETMIIAHSILKLLIHSIEEIVISEKPL